MCSSLVESDENSRNNQPHGVTMLYLDMGGDAVTTAPPCPPWPRAMTSKKKAKLCHAVLFFSSSEHLG